MCIRDSPLDGVVLTTGCDKTTPAALMAAATVNIPAIVLSGGPMLDGHYKGKKAGSGTIIWEARKLYSKGEINYDEFMDMATASSPSVGTGWDVINYFFYVSGTSWRAYGNSVGYTN